MSSLNVSATSQTPSPLVSGKGTQAVARLQSSGPSFAEALAQANANLARNSAPERSPGRPNRWQSLRYLVTGTRLVLPSFLLGLSQPQSSPFRAPGQPQNRPFRSARQVGGGMLLVPGHRTGSQSDWEIASPKAPATTDPGSIFGMAPMLVPWSCPSTRSRQTITGEAFIGSRRPVPARRWWTASWPRRSAWASAGSHF